MKITKMDEISYVCSMHSLLWKWTSKLRYIFISMTLWIQAYCFPFFRSCISLHQEYISFIEKKDFVCCEISMTFYMVV